MLEQVLDGESTEISTEQSEIASGAAQEPQKSSGLDALKEKAAEKDFSVSKPAVEEAAVEQKVAAYTPNFKFRASNKEYEIPEMFRGLMKDQESEKYVKQMMERAYGIDGLKERFNGTKQEYQQLKQQHEEIQGTIEYAKEAYKKGDLDTVWEGLGIDPEKVLQWAVEKVQLSQMPPDQRQVYEGRRAAEKRAWDLERTQNYQAKQQAQEESKYVSQMLDLVLERNDFSAVAQAYDSRKSKPGAFRELVVFVGQSETARSGKTLTPLEAAQKALELLGEQPKAQEKVNVQQVPQATQTVVNNQAPVKKVLPNVQGSKTASPERGKVKTLDDLKKRYDEIAKH